MSLHKRLADSGNENVEINLSPMIDCVFILLIFFIVTTVFVEEVGVESNKPESSSLNSLDNENILISITDNGVVTFNGRDIGVDGVTSIIKQEMVTKPDIPVIIEAGDKTPHDIFARVYGRARDTGVEKISFK